MPYPALGIITLFASNKYESKPNWTVMALLFLKSMRGITEILCQQCHKANLYDC